MSISGQYQTPEVVNGYVCWNCAEVAKAKKGENPASNALDPSSAANGANGSSNAANSANGSSGVQGGPASTSQSPAVVFGGVLASANGSLTSSSSVLGQNAANASGQTSASLWAPGGQLNITA